MRALAVKEWIKLRPWLGLIAAAHLGFAAWFFLSMRHQFRVEHAEMIFYQANSIGRLFYADLRYLPLATGGVIGVAQFLPEVMRGRLRLSMHLPIGLVPLVLAHLAIGLALLGAFLALQVALLALTAGTFFPAEFVTSALATAAPWTLAGVAAYLGAALVLIEPDTRYRAANLAVAGGLVWLCHLAPGSGVYDRALWGLVALAALMVPAILLAAARFRDGGTTA